MKIIKGIVNIVTWAVLIICAAILLVKWNEIPDQVAVSIRDNAPVFGDKAMLPVFLLTGAAFNILISLDTFSNSLFRTMRNAGAPRSAIDGMVCIFQGIVTFIVVMFIFMAV